MEHSSRALLGHYLGRETGFRCASHMGRSARGANDERPRVQWRALVGPAYREGNSRERRKDCRWLRAKRNMHDSVESRPMPLDSSPPIRASNLFLLTASPFAHSALPWQPARAIVRPPRSCAAIDGAPIFSTILIGEYASAASKDSRKSTRTIIRVFSASICFVF